jgi:hypothetical protein
MFLDSLRARSARRGEERETMTASGIYVGFVSGAPWWGVAAALALIGTGALYLLTRPSL